jgi:type VI secretion system protein
MPSFLLCGLAVLLAGCSAVDSVKSLIGLGPPRSELRTLQVSADSQANRGNATALDIVVVYDTAAVARLPATGPEWFRQRDALQKTLATAIEVRSLQVPATYPVFQVRLPSHISRSVAVLAFANYVAEEGWPAITLTPFKNASLRLRQESIDVSGH